MNVVFILSICGVYGQNWEFLENLNFEDGSVGGNQTDIEGFGLGVGGYSEEGSSIETFHLREMGEMGEIEEMVTCTDCNVSVTPSNIQAIADKAI